MKMSELASRVIYASDRYSKTCRICLNETKNGTKLYPDDPTSTTILDKIRSCFQIIVTCLEYLPNVICKNCIKELECAVQFRLKCVTFEERFNIMNQANMKNKTELLDDNVEQVECTNELDSNIHYAEQTASLKDKFCCNVCKKILKSKLSLSKHMVSMHHNRKPAGRMTGHGPNRRYHCTKCTYSTIYSQTLVNHMRVHTGDRPYHCHCGKSFSQAASLTTHQKTHSNKMSHICSTCGKQFHHAFSLKKHLLVHSTGQFTCSICKKCLKTDYSLTAHMNRHYNIRNFSCENCGDTFVTSTDLTNHKKIHNSEKKAKCHLCDYKTRAKKNLILHLKRHAGEKSFECDICSKGLYTRSDLRRHMRVHSREKPYPCPACAQRFSQPGSLNNHVRNLHGNADYQWSRTQLVNVPTVKKEKE